MGAKDETPGAIETRYPGRERSRCGVEFPGFRDLRNLADFPFFLSPPPFLFSYLLFFSFLFCLSGYPFLRLTVKEVRGRKFATDR